MKTKLEYKLNKQPELKKFLQKLSKLKVDVGIFEKEVEEESELPLAMVAKINEYGSMDQTIPARPFIRNSFSKNDNFKKEVNEAFKESVNQRDRFVSLFRKVGVFASGEIRKQFTIGEFKENAEYTKEKKRKNKRKKDGIIRPLIDSGQLRRAVTWRLLK